MVGLEEQAVVAALDLPLAIVVGHVLDLHRRVSRGAHPGPGWVHRRHPDRVIPASDLRRHPIG
jgi:hypothetical protein